MKKRAWLIHGWGGSPDSGWLGWLRNQLQNKGVEAVSLTMPDSEHPNVQEWVRTLSHAIGTPDEHCILIGHSLGCPTILHYLNGLQLNQKIGGALLIAGFGEYLGSDFDEIKPFTDLVFDWKHIRSVSKQIAIIHGQNDTVVPLKYAEFLQKQLQPEQFIVLQGKGHFGSADALETLPEAMEAVGRMGV